VINLKQMELAQFQFEQLKQQYPEIELVEIVESGVYPDHLWVKMSMPEDEDRMIEMGEVAANISTNILVDYGYHITISSGTRLEKKAA